MLHVLEDACKQAGHYIAGIGLIAIGGLICVSGRVQIEGLRITVKGAFARMIGLSVIILGILTAATGPFEWCGF